ncbi:MAG: D-alanyl-D-alanine carboxypeptidase/D-alanyl-D-alanine-endopeptidase [Candidatus Brocadiales bacterium]|nr:D-alanyl-D-alanine carboxypeptidase/D-alanyl-D-alanine-endopeptidase [Candidatus Bathyanammoxibius amoris]
MASRCKGTKKRAAFRLLKLVLASCLVLIALEARLCAGPDDGTLGKKIKHVLTSSSSSLKGASVGICVVSLPGEKELYSLNSDRLFIVASNMKLLTTAAALEYLGPEYRFVTTVYGRGDVSEGGVLNGDLIIKGGGDPNISGRFHEGRSTAVLEHWALELGKAGITEIGGDVIADDTWFDREHVHPDWPRNQLTRWYCAPVSALSFNDNCIELRMVPGDDGGVRVVKEPNTRYVRVHNSSRMTKKKKGANFIVYRKPGANEIFVKGKVRRGHLPATHFVTVDDPPLFLASVFREVLERNGIRVDGRVRLIAGEDVSSPGELHELASTASTMAQSVKVANTKSQNFYAEQILKTLGMEIKGEGSFAAGREVLEEFLLELGHPPDRYTIADGSGLSRNNRLSPRMLVDILAYMYKHGEGDVFYSSLSVSGTSGTMGRRLKKEPYKGRVRAKTGYISKASALSGYVETLSGKRLAFSILINDFKASNAKIKKVQDSICRALVNY